MDARIRGYYGATSGTSFSEVGVSCVNECQLHAKTLRGLRDQMTYKQWQVRNTLGKMELPWNEEIVKMARNRVKSSYHEDLVIDEDGYWLLQGWKGRTLYTVSSWKPAD